MAFMLPYAHKTSTSWFDSLHDGAVVFLPIAASLSQNLSLRPLIRKSIKVKVIHFPSSHVHIGKTRKSTLRTSSRLGTECSFCCTHLLVRPFSHGYLEEKTRQYRRHGSQLLTSQFSRELVDMLRSLTRCLQ